MTQNPTKPNILPVLESNILVEIKSLNQWVCWQYKLKKDWQAIQASDPEAKICDKIPVNAKTGRYASTTNPKTWSDFETACRHYRSKKMDGIGFVFTENDHFAGIDLDKCVDTQSGAIETWASEIVRHFDTYAELSPSGTGIHLLAKKTGNVMGLNSGAIEMYTSGRYFTVTGILLPGCSTTVNDRTQQFDVLYDELKQPQQGQIADSAITAPFMISVPSPPLTPTSTQPVAAAVLLDDHTLLQKAFAAANGAKTKKLYDGDICNHPSQSEADGDLVFRLAFYTKDPAQLDRLFRASGLMREKWDKLLSAADGRTHGQKNIDDALCKVTASYAPGGLYPPGQVQPQSFRPCTDSGNGERLAANYQDIIRYCHHWGLWLYWAGTHWQIDQSGHMKRLAKETARSIYGEAAQCTDDRERKALAEWAKQSESEFRKKAMLSSAESEPGIPVTPEELDADPWLFNVQNGTLNLKTGTLQPHSPADMITQMAPVVFDPGASAPLWQIFLDKIFAGSPGLINYTQRAIGYSMSGNISERCLFFLHGTGANGKSTLIEVVRSLLGPYGKQADFSTFEKSQNVRTRNDIACLKDARFVATVEASDGSVLDENLVKQMTGGDRVRARFLYHESFEFTPTFKAFIAANYPPKISGTDDAIWDRIRKIPFNVTIPKNEQDKQLAVKLKSELPGILNWALEGCLQWQKSGLGMPEEVKQATSQYRFDMDNVGQFIADCCTTNPLAKVPISELHESYEFWCNENDYEPAGIIIFGNSLANRGCTRGSGKIKGKSVRVWKGICLKTEKNSNSEGAGAYNLSTSRQVVNLPV